MGGGTPLTERVVVFDGKHQQDYVLYDQRGVLIGSAGPAPGDHRRLEIRADGTVLTLVTGKGSRAGHVILAAEGRELARVQSRRLVPRLIGMPAQRVTAEAAEIGSISERRGRWTGRHRLVHDHAGRPVAKVTQAASGTFTHARAYVVDLGDQVDAPLRATALCVGFLWDWSTVAWEAGS
jgi:hypothetical protein